MHPYHAHANAWLQNIHVSRVSMATKIKAHVNACCSTMNGPCQLEHARALALDNRPAKKWHCIVIYLHPFACGYVCRSFGSSKQIVFLSQARKILQDTLVPKGTACRLACQLTPIYTHCQPTAFICEQEEWSWPPRSRTDTHGRLPTCRPHG
jgi:hypothetical protein